MYNHGKEKLYSIILYYIYTPLKNLEQLKKDHFEYCNKLGLLGRIIISEEGINGTLSGFKKNIEKYMEYLKSIEGFEQIDFKLDPHHENVFPRLSIKIKKEIVGLKLDKDVRVENNLKKYLEPKEFFKFLQKEDENVVILDVRNNYEYDLGHFQKAINPNIDNFRDLPQWIDKNLSLFKNKTILTYCTGGVRCEKASLLLESKGIKKVYQLKGGILKYNQDSEAQGQLFQGKVYVFDKRISRSVNKKENIITGRDFFDQTPCERYINCANPSCNKQILCSEKNEIKYLGSCSQECAKNPSNRYILKNKNIERFQNKIK